MSETLRAMVCVAESPGHAFPGISLARALRARGHEVLVETSARWRDIAQDTDLRFAAVEDRAGMVADAPWSDWVARGARALLPLIRDFEPDVVVSDVVTPAPPIAAEAGRVRGATLMPVVYPLHPPGLPAYPLGMLPPRTPLGRVMWRLVEPSLRAMHPRTRWQRSVPRRLNAARAELGLPPLRRRFDEISSFGHPISEGLALVATFPQLEYPRRWPGHVRVTGPMLFELPRPEVELPRGDEPLVLVAASTTMDPRLDLLRVALEALAAEPVRVVATTAGKGWDGTLPDNAAVVEWVSHEQVSSEASLIVCVGGHGTVARGLAHGVPLLVCPAGGDMAVNGARVEWAGAGLMLPRPLLAPGPLRWAVRRLLAERRFEVRAREIAAWHRDNDGAARGADLVERYASR